MQNKVCSYLQGQGTHLDNLTIGKVAAKAAVNKETIRYYQSLGLVESPARAPGSIRRYGEATVARVRFIKRAQQLGFSLDEVKNLLQLEDGRHCGKTRKLAEHKLNLIANRIADLRRIQLALEGLVDECERGKNRRGCPIIRTLLGAP